ncbi:uncharacterized protein LOC125225152 [Leguminivora glycinivorella]|uniref:uncharacterized protein LOC125225152 n=1 Tax=Leguminivora glycinivorella TaxID=1035111 RepID=UPI002010A14E|nr:uncharacterized protein LOC125225152 [Leguminivora glycinivorella]
MHEEMGWRFQKTYEVGVSYGIIKDVDLDLNEKDMMENMTCGVEIVAVKRLSRKSSDGSGWQDSETVRICFKGPILPPYVYIHELRVKVEPYLFPVSICANCWRYGHTKKTCSKKSTCPKCGGNHLNCETTVFTCRNCSGSHMALDKTCPLYQKERKIRKIMAEFNCTYKKALNKYELDSSSPPALAASMYQENFPQTLSTTDTPVTETSTLESVICEPAYAKIVTTKAVVHSEVPGKNNVSVTLPRKTNRTKTKHNKPELREKDDIVNDNLTTMDTDVNHVLPETSNKPNEVSGSKLKFSSLIDKIKDIIFMKNLTIAEKIKLGVQTGVEWLLSFVMQNILDMSFLKSFFNATDG